MHRISAFTLSLSAICCLAAATRSAGTGVYTKEQAARGKNTYGEVCSKCHGDNLAGGDDAPALAGDEFLKHWNGKSANDLFELVRKTMPTDDPGGLSRRQYADVIAYMLSANDFPPGASEFPNDAASLNDIRIETAKP